jgi:hypothetical protein
MWMWYQEKHTNLPMGVVRDIRQGGWYGYDTVQAAGQPFVIRTQTRGAAGQALQAAGVALGPVVRPLAEKLP